MPQSQNSSSSCLTPIYSSFSKEILVASRVLYQVGKARLIDGVTNGTSVEVNHVVLLLDSTGEARSYNVVDGIFFLVLSLIDE
ncbi:hypothetical protein RHGRI_020394 [Rhododendron griersonianum]|uniref:Uncharacterized protein n=1 Tax=Rhododendron griersonianum TaxID=479676 RepID=A0AAV6JG83_9ERIC|nr:hypothetical protein RHGRI_020394 [Rhododendron griersonianum]